MARLVPELAQQVPGLSEPLHADPETERYRLFEAVDGFLDGAAASVPVVLFLDDLHWAAKPTLLMLRHLVRAPRTTPRCSWWARTGTPSSTAVIRWPRCSPICGATRRVERMALRGLDEGEVTAFVEAAADQPLYAEVAELAHTVYAETEGNPFFVGQVLRHLVESGAVVLEDGRWVRTADGRSHRHPRRRPRSDQSPPGLPSTTSRTASSRWRRSSAATSTPACSPRRPTWIRNAVLDALETAEQGRLVEATTGRARFTFVHALVRSTLYDEIPTTRRLRLHRRVAQALEPRAAGDDTLLPSLARHYCEAAALGETDKAIRYATAGRRACLRRTSRTRRPPTCTNVPWPCSSRVAEDEREHRGDLLIQLATAHMAAGDRGATREAAFEAVQHGRDVGRPDLLADAAINLGGIRVWSEAGAVDEGFIALCEEALDALPDSDSAERAMVLARLAGELYFLPEASGRRRALTDDAVAMARRLDDPAVIAFVLGSAHWGMWAPGTARERLAIAEEILQLGRAAGDRGLEFSGAQWAFSDLMELGDTDRADEMLAIEHDDCRRAQSARFAMDCGRAPMRPRA